MVAVREILSVVFVTLWKYLAAVSKKVASNAHLPYILHHAYT